jgi:23S rRNA (cytidine1920-2'-O)/16S rRNA (cytidine1409-2'-O)-methyltransferase
MSTTREGGTTVSTKRRFVSLLARLQQLRPDITDPQRLIGQGRVFVDGFPVTNAGSRVSDESSLTIDNDEPLRGERKLLGALHEFHLRVQGTTALDAGAAAGGFTKTLLDAGAQRVYAVDAGHGQLLGSLRQDDRVVVLERTNIADLTRTLVPDTVDVITLDLSYLSIARAVPQLEVLDIAASAVLVALVKPMFELGLTELPEASRWADAVELAARGVDASGWRVRRAVRSPIPGGRGAAEFFLHATRR